jgi:hypothetical protein
MFFLATKGEKNLTSFQHAGPMGLEKVHFLGTGMKRPKKYTEIDKRLKKY